MQDDDDLVQDIGRILHDLDQGYEIGGIEELNYILSNEGLTNLRIKLSNGSVYSLDKNEHNWLFNYSFDQLYSAENATVITELNYNLIEENGKVKLQDDTGFSGYLVHTIDPISKLLNPTFRSDFLDWINDPVCKNWNVMTSNSLFMAKNPNYEDWYKSI